MKLELAKKKLFEGFEIECFTGQNGDFYMSIQQISDVLQYSSRKSFDKVIERNKDVIGNSTNVILSVVEGGRDVSRERSLYTFQQLFQILRFTKQPKANLFMQWASITLEELIMERAELKFAKQEDKIAYEQKIEGLTDEVKEMRITLSNTKEKLETLIDNSTINSHQAQKLNKLARERVVTILGGKDSERYKKESRKFFKNLWLSVNDSLGTCSYRDINPTQYGQAVEHIKYWSMV